MKGSPSVKRPALLKRHPRVIGALVILLLAAVGILLEQGQRQAFLPEEGTVEKVVDGDTLHVAAGPHLYKVRLIGVDTPETYPSRKLDDDARRTGQDKKTITALGARASEFTRTLCAGRRCRLEYDPANRARGHRDRYERLLAYVWVLDDAGGETFVNAEIIRQGYGAAYTNFAYDDVRKLEFLALQREARDAGRGLWGEWTP